MVGLISKSNSASCRWRLLRNQRGRWFRNEGRQAQAGQNVREAGSTAGAYMLDGGMHQRAGLLSTSTTSKTVHGAKRLSAAAGTRLQRVGPGSSSLRFAPAELLPLPRVGCRGAAAGVISSAAPASTSAAGTRPGSGFASSVVPAAAAAALAAAAAGGASRGTRAGGCACSATAARAGAASTCAAGAAAPAGGAAAAAAAGTSAAATTCPSTLAPMTCATTRSGCTRWPSRAMVLHAARSTAGRQLSSERHNGKGRRCRKPHRSAGCRQQHPQALLSLTSVAACTRAAGRWRARCPEPPSFSAA